MKQERFHFLRVIACFALMLVMLLNCGCSKIAEIAPAPVETELPVEGPVGYVAAATCGDGFVAVGTGGRADYIGVDGEIRSCPTNTTVNLTDVYSDGTTLLISGENGTLLCSKNVGQSFEVIDLGTDATIYSAGLFRGMRFAVAEGGMLYRENPGGWEAIQLETENDLIDLAVANNCIVAMSAETDVFISMDGLNWKYENFNKAYFGLYPPYVFERAVGAGDTFFVLGYADGQPNYPLVMYTERGEVWMQKAMMQINGEYIDPTADLHITDICFNVDQIAGTLSGGRVLSMPECAQCNEILQLETTENLWATASRENGVLVCGENFFAQVLDSRQIRQDKIGAEQAYIDIELRRAVLIDVREADELAADGYIPGSIHVPLAEVEERLPELVPDFYDEIIFYCASGKRSQKATELAVDMGYQKVYNLGALRDWPYEIVKD